MLCIFDLLYLLHTGYLLHVILVLKAEQPFCIQLLCGGGIRLLNEQRSTFVHN